MERIDARDLPTGALDAAAAFHARIVPQARALAACDLAILFAPADHRHAGWRAAAIGELARAAAPARVNAVVSDNAEMIGQICAYLAAAPGVTGQVLQGEG